MCVFVYVHVCMHIRVRALTILIAAIESNIDYMWVAKEEEKRRQYSCTWSTLMGSTCQWRFFFFFLIRNLHKCALNKMQKVCGRTRKECCKVIYVRQVTALLFPASALDYLLLFINSLNVVQGALQHFFFFFFVTILALNLFLVCQKTKMKGNCGNWCTKAQVVGQTNLKIKATLESPLTWIFMAPDAMFHFHVTS